MLIAKPPYSFTSTTIETLVPGRTPGTLGNPGSVPPRQNFAALYCWSSRLESFSQGYKNSDYRERLVQGKLIPMTPWTGFKSQYRVTEGVHDAWMPTYAPYYHYVIDGGMYSFVYSGSASPPPWYKSQADLQNILNQYDARYFVQAAAAKIATSGWDELTFAAEFAKTVAMFRGFTTRLISLAKAGKLEQIWLEGRYGWRQLIFDLQDIDKAIRNLNEGKKRFFERVGTTISKTETRQDVVPAAIYGQITMTTAYQYSIGLRGSVAADIEPPRIQLNPLATAWEVTKLSFVIDWIVNVGQFLDGLSFLALQREYTAAAGMAVKLESEQSSSVSWLNGSYGTWLTSSEQQAQLVVRIPSSVSTIPLTKLRLNAFKVLDLVALFVQAVIGTKFVGKVTGNIDYYFNSKNATKDRRKRKRK